MSEHIIKNIEVNQILALAELVTYQPGQVVSRTLAQNKAVSLTLFAFDKDEEISSHSSHGDAMVTILEGKAKVTIGKDEYSIGAGQTIVMPAGIAHAVAADGPFKMYLTVIFPA
jgi:quercetin dioxygenase-like cupin family protein